MSFELYTVTPHGVTRRLVHTARDVNNLDALLDARLEFAARQSAAYEALLREWWLESYPRTEPPAWPVDQASEPEVAA